MDEKLQLLWSLSLNCSPPMAASPLFNDAWDFPCKSLGMAKHGLIVTALINYGTST